MSNNHPEMNRHDAMILGLAKAVQAIAAVTYHTSPKRDALEEQVNIYLDKSGLDGDLLTAYKMPLEGVLQVIQDIKDAQPKK